MGKADKVAVAYQARPLGISSRNQQSVCQFVSPSKGPTSVWSGSTDRETEHGNGRVLVWSLASIIFSFLFSLFYLGYFFAASLFLFTVDTSNENILRLI